MNTVFCSEHSRQAGEDIIGSASNYQIYILVECPQPWASDAFNSRWVPENLQILIKEVKRSKIPINFLLIANNLSHKVDQTTLLIYKIKDGLGDGYYKQEFKLANIEQVAPVVRQWLLHGIPECEVETSPTRDLLVCTHGSHDHCCARYGNPFFFHATATISHLDLENIRIWKSSHFGGHRFAPTLIDLPSGRYYGNLEQETFRQILTRSGDIKCLNKVYRGWGILPPSIQVLEREFILHYGWDWFNYKVVGRTIEQSLDKNTIQAELTFQKPDGSLHTYQGKMIKYDTKNMQIKASCSTKKESVFVKYAVTSLTLTSNQLLTCSK